MTALLIFALVLLVAVLASGLAERTAASVAILFICVGMVAGHGGLGWIDWQADAPMVEHVATLTLVAVLLADGTRIGLAELRQCWQLPGRALLLGMPITLGLLTTLAHWLAGLDWLPALLLAAVLTPTDPVFAAAIVGRDEVALPLRRLLNVESGLNDGLSLPVVLLLIGQLGHESEPALPLLGEVALGAGIGAAVPRLARWLRPRGLHIAEERQPLYGVALGLVSISLASLLHANIYLAAFLTGVSFASADPALREHFQALAHQVGEVLKLSTLLLFGALLAPSMFVSLQLRDYLFAVSALLVARPLGLLLALSGSRLDMRHRLAAAWFGPKGFASLIYAVLVLRAGLPDSERLFHLAAFVILLSIAAHTTTDVPLARWLQRHRPAIEGAAPAKDRTSTG